MLRFGDALGETIDSTWKEEVEAINMQSIPNEDKLVALKNSLKEVNSVFHIIKANVKESVNEIVE